MNSDYRLAQLKALILLHLYVIYHSLLSTLTVAHSWSLDSALTLSSQTHNESYSSFLPPVILSNSHSLYLACPCSKLEPLSRFFFSFPFHLPFSLFFRFWIGGLGPFGSCLYCCGSLCLSDSETTVYIYIYIYIFIRERNLACSS